MRWIDALQDHLSSLSLLQMILFLRAILPECDNRICGSRNNRLFVFTDCERPYLWRL